MEGKYKFLEDSLGQCFPCRQDPLPCKIPTEKIYLAPNSFKYHIFVEKRKEQVQLEQEALGTIWRKPELYCIPLKRAPVPGRGPEDKGQSLILQQMLEKDMMWAIDGEVIPLVPNQCPLVCSWRLVHLSSVPIQCGEGGAWVYKAQILHGIRRGSNLLLRS